ncbi:MAG TPA: hypothetical protein VK530_09520 [Candidatus Acidoferrum sp.]|nr:hypothetical protein [Candidatus Acidoferrum sp.]
MNSEAFVRWALNDARTVEERYTVELLVEHGMRRWKAKHKILDAEPFQELMERKRQRALNPAYDPRVSEQALRCTAEVAAELTIFRGEGGSREKPTRDLAALRFFPAIEELQLSFSEVEDVSPLTELPRLRSLHLGTSSCQDYRPLARCAALTDLQLRMGRHWPEVDGMGNLPNLKTLKLQGNLLVFEAAVFPNVISAAIICEPLALRSVRDLPQLPGCRFLHLGGTETLDGIEAFAELRNLTLARGGVESFAPLTGLKELTCLTVLDPEPHDLSPLVRLPKLYFLALDTSHTTKVVKPRDVAQLVDSMSLREFVMRGSAVIETEAAAVKAGLASWNDLFVLSQPRALAPLKMIAAPLERFPKSEELPRMPQEPEIVDIGLRQCELRWAARRLERTITRKLGSSDWGECNGDFAGVEGAPHLIEPRPRHIWVEWHAYALLEKYPLFIEAIREFLAEIEPEYHVSLMNLLKAIRPKLTPEQEALEEKRLQEQDEEEYEQRQRENHEYLERLHRYELKKQEGAKINPAEFAPTPLAPLFDVDPPENDEPSDDADDDSGGDVAVAKPPEPPPSWDDEAHPLADKYTMLAKVTLTGLWLLTHQRGVGEYLLQRNCDEVIKDQKRG